MLDDTVRTLRIRRGETTELVVENTPILGQIQVVKKSAQDNPVTNQPKGSLLEGAVFEITNADTGRVVDTMTSGCQRHCRIESDPTGPLLCAGGTGAAFLSAEYPEGGGQAQSRGRRGADRDVQ